MLSIFDRFSFWFGIFIYTVFNNFFKEQNIQIQIYNDFYHTESINGIKIAWFACRTWGGIHKLSWPLLIHTLGPISFGHPVQSRVPLILSIRIRIRIGIGIITNHGSLTLGRVSNNVFVFFTWQVLFSSLILFTISFILSL